MKAFAVLDTILFASLKQIDTVFTIDYLKQFKSIQIIYYQLFGLFVSIGAVLLKNIEHKPIVKKTMQYN